MTETNKQPNNAIASSTLLDAINALHEQWIIETNGNRNIERWDGDEEWRRINAKLVEARALAVKSTVNN